MPSRPLSATSFGALRKLARTFRYAALSELVGRRVWIADVASIPDLLRAILQPVVGEVPTWKGPHDPTPALAKYGLVDATFVVSHRYLERVAPGGGFAALRELGMVTPSEDADLDEEVLLSTVSDLAPDNGFLKLFLVADVPPWRWEETRPSRSHLDGSLPPEYLPREFVIDDACVTNWDVVWCEKHFYL